MANDSTGDTYLLVDVGHVLTHAAYVARVEGVARLVGLAEASTTSPAASGGLLEGVRRATANLELLIGRRILDVAGGLRRPCDADGHGVDAAVLTTSLAPPLRVTLVGLTQDFSLASAVRAATVPYVALTHVICLELSERRWESEDLEVMAADPPDAVVMVGGIDGGPVAPIRDMGEMLRAAYSVLPEALRPVVLFAGNERAHRPLIAAFSGVTELHLIANVRPSVQAENLGELRAALSRLFHRRVLGGAAELRALGEWAGSEVLYDTEVAARTLRFVAQRYAVGKGVLGVDLGGNGTRVLLVRPEGTALSWTSPYGTGAGLAALRGLSDLTAVARWMRHSLSWAEVWDRLSNVEVRPAGVPQTDEDWDLQEAAAREAVCRTWTTAQQAWGAMAGNGRASTGVELVLGRGTALTHARTPGQAALTLIDALQPVGVLRLALDWANLLPGLAGVARLNARAAVQVLDSDGLLELGTLVAVGGRPRPGQEALNVRMLTHGETRAEFALPFGCLRRLPLGVNEQARLELHPARGVDLGLGQRGRGAVADVRGGELGVVIDARGRPLRLPRDEAERGQAMEAWQREIDET